MKYIKPLFFALLFGFCVTSLVADECTDAERDAWEEIAYLNQAAQDAARDGCSEDAEQLDSEINYILDWLAGFECQ